MHRPVQETCGSISLDGVRGPQEKGKPLPNVKMFSTLRAVAPAAMDPSLPHRRDRIMLVFNDLKELPVSSTVFMPQPAGLAFRVHLAGRAHG